jgi:hypothetical protein
MDGASNDVVEEAVLPERLRQDMSEVENRDTHSSEILPNTYHAIDGANVLKKPPSATATSSVLSPELGTTSSTVPKDVRLTEVDTNRTLKTRETKAVPDPSSLTNSPSGSRGHVCEALPHEHRTRWFVFSSEIGIQTERADKFTQEEEAVLRKFQKAYAENRTAIFPRDPLPTIAISLVKLSPESQSLDVSKLALWWKDTTFPSSVTGINITGLCSDQEIKTFHEFMCQAHIRNQYSPMKLCFERSLIQRMAGRAYYICKKPGGTLCGTPVKSPDIQSPTFSTIGGIIRVGSRLYGMTSLHGSNIIPNDDGGGGNAAMANSYSWSADSDPLFDLDGVKDDAWPVLILDDMIPKRQPRSWEPRVAPQHNGTPNLWRTRSSKVFETSHPERGDDWKLIPLKRGQCLPNAVDVPRWGIECITECLDKEELEKLPAQILTGSSDRLSGTLCASPAFVSFGGATPTEVWTVMLDGNTRGLQAGDSGSWAVDRAERWVGTVTAATRHGTVYLVPAHVQLQHMKEEIQEKHGLEVALPSPLRCYLELVIRSDPVYDSGTIAQFLIDGLSSDILLASVSDAPVMAATLWKAKRKIPSLELALAELFSFCKSYNQFERLLQAPTLSHLSLDNSNLPPLMETLASLRRWYHGYDCRLRSGEGGRDMLEGRVVNSVSASDCQNIKELIDRKRRERGEEHPSSFLNDPQRFSRRKVSSCLIGRP